MKEEKSAISGSNHINNNNNNNNNNNHNNITTETQKKQQPKSSSHNINHNNNHNIVFYLIIFFRTDAEVLWNLPGFGVPKGDEIQSCKVGPKTSYNLGYNSYNPSYPIIRPFKGVITPFITGRGPPCGSVENVASVFRPRFPTVPPWLGPRVVCVACFFSWTSPVASGMWFLLFLFGGVRVMILVWSRCEFWVYKKIADPDMRPRKCVPPKIMVQ